ASALRLLTGARQRTDAALLAAAPGSVLLSTGALAGIHALGGFRVFPAAAHFSPVSGWGDRARMLLGNLVPIAYGGYLPEKHGVLPTALGLVHLIGLPLVVTAVCVVLY